MEHPNAHAVGPATSTQGYTRLPGPARRSLLITSCAAMALAATPLITHVVGTPTASQLRPVDPAAAQVTMLGPHVVVYSVPTKKGNGGSKHHRDSGDDSGSGGSDSRKEPGDSSSATSKDSHSSGDSGDASVSNTVNGAEVGGAQTYNNHTSASTGVDDTGSTSSPVQLKGNTGAGTTGPNSLNSQGGGAAAGATGVAATGPSSAAVSAAPAVMLMQVSCPASVASGTVCLQVMSVGGARAAGLPANSSAASLPIDTGAGADTASLPGASTLSSGSSTSALGQAETGGRVDVSALESQSGEKIELTGYSFQDNQGGNNAKISCPQIHQQAGGTGTFTDPITVASGGKSGGSSADGIKCGDRFYIPAVQRYVIVEDTGNTPNKSMPHLDMYVADDPNKSCMNKISGTVTAIPHPPSGLPVLAGPIGDHGSCRLPGGEQ